MSTTILPWMKGLASARLLREAGCKLRYGTSNPKAGVATSWGCRTAPPWADRMKWINHPSGVRHVSDKLAWSQLGLGPESTTSIVTAKQWASEVGEKVVCRTVLNGRSGEGIVIARNAEQVVDAPLYTQYFKKDREYRVVFSPVTGVVYKASKRLRPNTELERDALLVRTLANGFTYQVEHELLPLAVCCVIRVVGAQLSEQCGLNLLAYDVAYNSGEDRAVVIEANTAWGMNEYSAELTAAAMVSIGEML